MQVYFIAHGNAQIGMGHVMRTLSLAEAFRDSGHNVSFFSRYQQGTDIIARKGFDVEQLENHEEKTVREGFFYGNPKELSNEISVISKKLMGHADLIVVDSYNVTSLYFTELRKLTTCLAYIDDLNAFFYPVDILINGTASAEEMGYREKQRCKLLIGMKYNLLRKEFCNIPLKNVQRCISDVLITTGNSDPFNMTQRILKTLLHEKDFKDFNYHIIVGGGFGGDIWEDTELIKSKRVILYDRPSNMAEIMLKCNLAISAGGSTIYELASCGLPIIAFSYADNQVPHIRTLEREGVLKYVGPYEALDSQMLIDSIVFWKSHYEDRKRIIERLQALVDGNGVYRIVKEVEQCMEK